jgi:hypothetical protein
MSTFKVRIQLHGTKTEIFSCYVINLRLVEHVINLFLLAL